MKKITENQKEKIFEITNDMALKINGIMREIEDTQNMLSKFCNAEKLATYYTWTIDERLKEAKIRLEMAETRISEFRDEAESLLLSEGGLY